MSQIPPPQPPQRPQPPLKPQYDHGAAAKPAGGGNSGVLIVLLVIGGIFAVMALCVVGVLAALLIPAIGSAQQAAKRAQSMNNVKQLTLAMLNYETTFQKFPPQYTIDASGQPLLSWRAQLLPFMEQQPLYDQLNQNEAWDSPANAGLTDTQISMFLSPRYGQSGNLTNYVAVAGEGFAFNGPQQIAVPGYDVHAEFIAWAEPRDLSFGDLKFEDLGASPDAPNVVRRGAVIGFADGHVISMQFADPEELRKMLTIDGQEPVNAW